MLMLTQGYNLSAPDPQVKAFMELFLVTLLLQPHSALQENDHEARLGKVFDRTREAPELAGLLQIFIRRIVSKGGFGSGQGGQLRSLCKMVDKTLSQAKAIQHETQVDVPNLGM